jgi:NitT/TauT family transport system substrate-binding protein
MKSPFFNAISILVALLSAVSAQAQGQAQKVETIRLGNLKFAHYGAVSYMKELGPKCGLKIEEKMFPKGIDIIPAIIAGEIDIAASAADAAIAGRAAGTPVFAVAGFAKGGARTLARNDAGIKNYKDMKGKKVAVARGGAQELLLLAELAKNGLTWSDKPGKDVLIIYMAFQDINTALMTKQVDAACQSEPYSSQAISQGFATEVNKPYDTPLGEPIRVLVMTEKLYKERPEVAQKVMNCFVQATKLFIEKPAIAEKYVRENMFKNQLSSKEYKDAIGNSPFTYELTAEHIQTTTDMMIKYDVGRMQNPPKATDWVKLDLLAKAKQANGIN